MVSAFKIALYAVAPALAPTEELCDVCDGHDEREMTVLKLHVHLAFKMLSSEFIL